ncbi:MAG: dUTP diphosphatase [Hyphomicrobiales bacterium]
MPGATIVRIRRLAHARDLDLPAYQSAGAAGMDLASAVDRQEPVTIDPGERALVPTGLSIELPEGFEAQVRPRSGLAARHGVTVLNTPGTIDADYRGEIKVILINHGAEPFTVARGERIAQLVVQPVARVTWEERDALSSSGRGEGGFGSSGG